jgi:hypothetical protein
MVECARSILVRELQVILARVSSAWDAKELPSSLPCVSAGFTVAGRPSMSDVTQILDRVQHGDARAAEELVPLVYEDLRRLAAAKMAQLPPGQTLQPTALVHEAYLRLVGSGPRDWNSREPRSVPRPKTQARSLAATSSSRRSVKAGAASFTWPNKSSPSAAGWRSK